MDSEIKARKAKIINFEGYKSCRKISVFHTPEFWAVLTIILDLMLVLNTNY